MIKRKGQIDSFSLLLITIIVIFIIVGLIILFFYINTNQNKVIIIEQPYYDAFNNTKYLIQKNVTIKSIKIASWNLQIFGIKKAGEVDVMNFYKQKLSPYDIIFIEEVRDSSGTAFKSLCLMFNGYNCNISERDGRSNSKEQIGVIYKDYINVVSLYNIPDPNDVYERSPTKIIINVSNIIYTFYVVHTKPDDVVNELRGLETFSNNDSYNTIIIGDLNADCDYYNTKQTKLFKEWEWLIPDDADTTVSSNNCAYDRIIIKNVSNILSYGIDSKGIYSMYSDHYIVFVEFGG
jgi:hypothetical protein